MNLRHHMHTVQYLLAGNMNIRPYMHTVQNLLTGNCYVRPYTHFVQHILTEMRNFRPYLLTGNGMLDLIHTHYRICWQKKGLCYIRVSLHYAVCTNICAGKGQLKKLLASYCGSLWEKTTVERERKKSCGRGEGDRKCGSLKHCLPDTTSNAQPQNDTRR